MADPRQIIQTIMSDPKLATSRNFAATVYRDEPILISARQMEAFTPPRIREMRRLAKANGNEAKTFHEQGMFMADFEDDFEYRGEYVQYFPTYQAMSDAQLRGYFSWRTKVRRGEIARTSLSFAFVYIYELLNQIGVSTPEDGFLALKRFWTAYRDIEPRIDGYVTLWLKDYAVYYNLDASFLDGLPDITFDRAVAVLLDHESREAGEVFSALNSLSSYDLEQSKFYKQHPDDVANVVCRVFAEVSRYYNRNPKKNARETLFGRMCTNFYSMFRSAVFYHRTRQEDRVYAIGDWHKYTCHNGHWDCERFVWYGLNNKRIGALLKTVDYLMRQRYGHKSSLQPGKTNKIITRKIEKIVEAYEREKRENTPPDIAIDVSRLHAIRAAAQATRDRLIVEDEEERAPEPVREEPAPECGIALSDAERAFLLGLLYGDRGDGDGRNRGQMLSLVVDGINEKLFDAFGDTVIVEEDGGPALVEDYRDELKGMFPR